MFTLRNLFIPSNPSSYMKRKVVLHGQSTLTISLPARWIKKFNIKKGDELDVKEFGNELKINSEKEPSLGKKQLDVKNMKRLGKTYITSSYRQGYDEINLEYDDPAYTETIQDLITKEITGFEIIKQGHNYCSVKDLTGHNKEELDLALRRTWRLVIDLSEESLNAIEEGDPAKLRNIQLMDYSINKFCNYCLRILTKEGHTDFRKTPLYYSLIKNLEEIGDQYKDLCNFYSKNKEKADGELVELLTEISKQLNKTYELCYKYDEQQTEDLLEKNKLMCNKILKVKNNRSLHLFPICTNVRNLLHTTVEINF